MNDVDSHGYGAGRRSGRRDVVRAQAALLRDACFVIDPPGVPGRKKEEERGRKRKGRGRR